jgi:hypothetical protein
MRRKPETCQANTGLPTSPAPPCYRLFMSELDARTTTAGGESLLDSASLSSSSALKADFMVEMTDPGPAGAPIAGTDVGGTGSSFQYVSVSLTTTALVMPAAAACGPQASIGQQRARSVVVVGPVGH